MKTLAVVIACGLLGCGGGGSSLDGTLVVEDITTNQQVTLCEQFLDDVCTTQVGTSFCARDCIMTACRPAAENGNIDEQCNDGVTVMDVDDCGTSGDNTICVTEMGGCMFDALEAACAQ
ncbi:MAG TPA: hypothetical protein VGM90_16880 [Kofleriaceae bacterium]|jgi:hypothetical protein